jgi:hypothetical protein|tara:strand:+ start:357 stop:548 length:192 start_codon:yes stop_codon:yes gene_type:complete
MSVGNGISELASTGGAIAIFFMGTRLLGSGGAGESGIAERPFILQNYVCRFLLAGDLVGNFLA